MTNASRQRCPRLGIRNVRRLLVTSYLQDVPIAVISAWLGHASKAFTMATYVHSQPEALTLAAQSFNSVVGESRRS